MTAISEAFSIALRHHQAGRLTEAEPIYRQILAADPNHADAWHLLGVAACQSGSYPTAVEYIQRALAHRPDWAEALGNLGNAWQAQGKVDEAVACYERALQLKPDFAETLNNLGNIWQAQAKVDAAVTCYERALQLKPDYAEAHNNLGNARLAQRKLDEAVACFQRALQLKPDFAEAHSNLGNAWQAQAKLDAAVACYQRALQLNPGHAESLANLANAWQAQGKLDEAVVLLQRALVLQPDCVEALTNLANASQAQGKVEDAVAGLQRVLQLKPDFVAAHDNLLCTIQYRSGVTLPELAAAHAEYDRRHAAPLRADWKPHGNDRDADRRLRLGFVSPDFGRHPVGFFLIRTLENLGRDQCDTICYSDRHVTDELTLRFQACATSWRDVSGLTDAELTEQIRADAIDILFDLAGHTAHNRLLVFARKSAPIQITWIGYEGTTGLAAMDYLLADRHMVPPGCESSYQERILRMPDGYLCYDPPAAAPAVGPLPALQTGSVTIGSFNNLAKITPQVVEVWSQILQRVPTSRLIMKYRGLGDPSVKRRYLELFAAHGVEARRLELLPPSSYAEYLATYEQVDLLLDPFPFSGSTTTCEALWMGVPVITCPGETFASRHSLDHLANVGLTETIARDLNEYVELAVALANDLPRLARLRAGLRARMAASPLCDGKRFAANLETVLRGVWREWCQNGESPPYDTSS